MLMKTSPPTEEQIQEVASRLEHFEEWLAKTDTAGSALGRHVLQDQAILSRWRHNGIKGASLEKRRELAIFILENPNGIPGYTKGKSGRKKQTRRLIGASARFTPDKTPLSSNVNAFGDGGGYSTSIPVPSLSTLESQNDIDWIKCRAFQRGVAITTVLAEMVSLGVRIQQETEYEEEHEQNQENFNGTQFPGKL